VQRLPTVDDLAEELREREAEIRRLGDEWMARCRQQAAYADASVEVDEVLRQQLIDLKAENDALRAELKLRDENDAWQALMR
jgi:hypothetical protein